MGLPRSTYYDAPPAKADDAETVAAITAICNEFEA
jgi:putative transposase